MKIIIFILCFIVSLASTNPFPHGCSITINSESNLDTQFTNNQLLNCLNSSIFWSYPTGNLTALFSADINKSKSFEFCLFDSIQIYSDIPVYRVVNGQEFKITKNDNKVCMISDSTNTVTLKLVGPKSLKYYGVFIDVGISV